MAEQRAAFLDDKELQRFLRGMEKRYQKVEKRQRDYVVLISAIVFRNIIEHFEKEEGPDGKWDYFSSSYLAAIKGEVYFRRINGTTLAFEGEHPTDKRPRQGKLGQLLQDTGQLRQKLQPIRRGGNFRKTSKGLLWFNNARTATGFPYAAHHDEGQSSWRGRPRPFMYMNDEGMEDVAKQTLAFMLEGR